MTRGRPRGSKNVKHGSRIPENDSIESGSDDYAIALFKKIKAGEMTLSEIEMTVDEPTVQKVKSMFKRTEQPLVLQQDFDRTKYFTMKEFAAACQLSYVAVYQRLRASSELRNKFTIKQGKLVLISKNIFGSGLWKEKRIDKGGRGFVIRDNNQRMRNDTIREKAGGLFQYEAKFLDEAIERFEKNLDILKQAKEILTHG